MNRSKLVTKNKQTLKRYGVQLFTEITKKTNNNKKDLPFSV